MGSWHGHLPKKLPAPLASTTSRSNIGKDVPTSLRAWRCAHKACNRGATSRGGSGFGRGAVCQPSQRGLTLGGSLQQGGQVCPVSNAPSWPWVGGCLAGCRFRMSLGAGRAASPGAAARADAAPRPGGAAGTAGPSSAGGELGTGGAFCGLCQLPLFALFSSSPLVAEQRALWLRTTGNVIKPHAPGPSSRGAGGRPGRSLEAGGICCRHCGASAPAGGVWVVVGISLSLQVRRPHPPVC